MLRNAPSQPDPVPRPLDHLLERGGKQDVALVLKDASFTYEALGQRVSAIASRLRKSVAPGARIATWAGKGELTCLMPLACARAGLVHVPINPLLKRAQAKHIVTDCGASMLIANDGRLNSLKPGDLPHQCMGLTDDVFLGSTGSGDTAARPSAHDPADLAAILYTSGSTGAPKGVMLSHANLWLGAVSVAHYLGLAPDDRTLAVLPLSFDYGQNQLLSTWYAGGRVVPLDYLFARDVIQACERHRITTLAGVPPLWLQFIEAGWTDASTASLRRVTNSGGALTPDLIGALKEKMPETDIYAMYGLTEAFRSTYLKPHLLAGNPTSIGTAIPFAEVLVVTDDGRIAQTDEEGELVHCGPLVALGYWNDAERTAQRFRPAPAESKYGGTAVWSGDRVRRDGQGLLHFVGRRDAMIKSSGNRISPHEIEHAALETGLVAQAIAFGVADARLGHAIHLALRAHPGRDDVQETVRANLARTLPTFMQPHVYHWRDDLPRNPNGKVDRVALIAEYTP